MADAAQISGIVGAPCAMCAAVSIHRVLTIIPVATATSMTISHGSRQRGRE